MSIQFSFLIVKLNQKALKFSVLILLYKDEDMQHIRGFFAFVTYLPQKPVFSFFFLFAFLKFQYTECLIDNAIL